MSTEKLITDPVELAAAYGLPWPDGSCTCCGARIVDGRCVSAGRCDRPAGRPWCAGLEEAS